MARPDLAGPDNAYRIVSMRRDGHDYTEIAAQLNVTVEYVKRVCYDAAAEVRRAKKDLVDEAFMLSHQRLELLWYEAYKSFRELCDATDAPTASDWKRFVELGKLLLAIETRKSSLMSLDANKTQMPPKAERAGWDWLANPQVSDAEVHAEIKRRGWGRSDRFAALKPATTAGG